MIKDDLKVRSAPESGGRQGMEAQTQENYGVERPAEEEGAIKIVSFFLDGEEYAFDVADAVEVLRPKNVTEVPRTPAFIKGILSVRGEMVPVICLKKLLGIKSPASDNGAGRMTRILLAGAEESKAGFSVDRIGGVKEYRVSLIEETPGGGFIKGIIHLDGGVINILDINRLLGV